MPNMGATASFLVTEPEALWSIMEKARTIAIIGVSSQPVRPSYEVAEYLKKAGYQILPVNPVEKEVLGIPSVSSLRDLSVCPDVVLVFRRSSEVAPHVDEVIAMGARVLWLQDGVVDLASAHRAHDAGILVVMNRCMMRDHAALAKRFG